MKIKLARMDEDLVLAAGKYWVGDPCYVFPNDNWSDFCNVMMGGHGNVYVENGIKFFVAGTAHGDGEYELRLNGDTIGQCPVDAGMLSVVPAALLKRWKSEKNRTVLKDFGGVWIELTALAGISQSGGDISFGNYTLNTSGNDEEDEDECRHCGRHCH